MSSRVCPECGREIAANPPAGMCPACLLQLGVTAAQRESSVEEANGGAPAPLFSRLFGDYEMLDEVARGGMGVVFRARQISLNRIVALKLVDGGVFATSSRIRRFKLEAETAARLDHPNIVPIYEVGEHDGQRYFSMKLMEGGTLLDAMKRNRFTPRAAAELMAVIARTVHFAHQRGILHRDLKPTNILLDKDGRPHITDFGLAKLLEGENDLTVTLAVMGTPAYMSPEQASGKTKDLTTAADLYSLGAVLYELLSGHPPFTGGTAAAVLRQVVEAEPSPLRKSTPAVDSDLETICLKCLEKDPAGRYGSAADLADELERWLTGRPILARPASTFERCRRWLKRNPVLALVSAALLLSLLTGGIMLARAYARAEVALKGARENLYRSILTQSRAQLAAKEMGQHHDVLRALQRAAQIRWSDGIRSVAATALMKPDFRRVTSWRMFVPTVGVFVGFSPDLRSYVGAVLSSQGGCELRAAETGTLLRSFSHRAGGATGVRLRRSLFSRDGRYFAACYDNGKSDVWAIDGQEPIVQLSDQEDWGTIEFTPDGRHFVAHSKKNGLSVWSLADRSRRELQPPGQDARFLRFNPVGDRLAVVRRDSVEVRDFPEGRLKWSAPMEVARQWAAWGPDGKRLAVANTYTHDILIFDVASSNLLARLAGHFHEPLVFEFHPTGQWLLSNGRDHTLRLWDARSGQELLHGSIQSETALQFSTDGQRFATGVGPNEIGLYELTLPHGFREFSGTASVTHRVHSMDVSPSGRFLVSGSQDGVRIWDVKAGKEAHYLRRPFFDSGYHLFFGPDDREIIYSRKGEGTFRRELTWQENESGKPANVTLGPELKTPVPPGTFLCSVGTDRRTWLSRDSPTGAIVLPNGRIEGSRKVSHATERLLVTLSPDGRWSAAICNEDRRYLDICDVPKLTSVTNMGSLRVRIAAFSPDSRWLIAASDYGHHVWETGSWKKNYVFSSLAQGSAGIAFSADSRRAALLQPEDTILLVSLPDGRALVRLKPPFPLMASSIALSPDGNRVWLLGVGHRLYEWDVVVLRSELAELGLDWPD